MKQEIKERIEKIRNWEVLDGYQETRVGIIPGDWDVVEADMKSFLEELGL